MRLHRQTRLPRRGASLVEFAVVGPVALLLLIGLVVMAMGVYRYQQVAALAREGSRYASVHGGMYAKETGNTAATQQDIHNNAVLAYAGGLDIRDRAFAKVFSVATLALMELNCVTA